MSVILKEREAEVDTFAPTKVITETVAINIFT